MCLAAVITVLQIYSWKLWLHIAPLEISIGTLTVQPDLQGHKCTHVDDNLDPKTSQCTTPYCAWSEDAWKVYWTAQHFLWSTQIANWDMLIPHRFSVPFSTQHSPQLPQWLHYPMIISLLGSLLLSHMKVRSWCRPQSTVFANAPHVPYSLCCTAGGLHQSEILVMSPFLAPKDCVLRSFWQEQTMLQTMASTTITFKVSTIRVLTSSTSWAKSWCEWACEQFTWAQNLHPWDQYSIVLSVFGQNHEVWSGVTPPGSFPVSAKIRLAFLSLETYQNCLLIIDISPCCINGFASSYSSVPTQVVSSSMG